VAVSSLTNGKTISSPMKMGMVLFLISETFLFGSLFWAYYYLRGATPGWPPQHPSATLPVTNTILLIVSSISLWWSGRAIRIGQEKGLLAGLIITFLLGCAFLGITAWEWTHESFRPWSNAYGSIFFTMTGFHALHIFGGVTLLLALIARSARHRFSSENHLAVNIISLYWHFVDLIWIFVFLTIFIIR
jgi:cytochrome c oxidase subunit III